MIYDALEKFLMATEFPDKREVGGKKEAHSKPHSNS